jgi:predicted TIM-barrel enzyme
MALECGGANGIIVGTNLKHAGVVANRIDPERVKRLAQGIQAMG